MQSFFSKYVHAPACVCLCHLVLNVITCKYITMVLKVQGYLELSVLTTDLVGKGVLK